jgi:hypothetical protein
MARARITVPEGYGPDFDRRMLEQGEEDDSLWVNFYVNPTRTLTKTNKDGSNMRVRDISWSFSGDGNQWWNTYATLWNDKTGEIGDILAQLFPPADGKKFIRTRIMYDVTAVYCEEGNERIPFYLRIDPKEQHIWLHRPWYEDDAKEQRAVWDAIVGKQWVDLYTLQGNDSPAIYQQSQEKPKEQELVTSGVSINEAGLVDL